MACFNESGELPHVCGLVNQGATCYLNSLLQALYHLTVFRNGVFRLPADKDPVVKAMQVLFIKMESADVPVATENLTESFGWDSYESYKQHDVQELLQVLVSDKIESCFKKYLSEANVVKEMFTGTFSSYIRVTDPSVEYENSVDEPYTDIQLNIKNFDKTTNTDIMECLRAFQTEDQLTGANQYELEKDGKKSLHDAVKGMRIKTFPDILFLHLKRFRQDNYGRAEKVTESLTYTEELDVSEFSPSTPSEDNLFTLYAVMVHKGSSASFGHYYSFINVGLRQWIKFDDTRVTKATRNEAIADNFGSNSYMYGCGHAYLLVYIRKSKAEHIISPPKSTRPEALLKSLTAMAHDDDVSRSPTNYNRVTVVQRRDVEYALATGPTDADMFLKALRESPTAVTINQKKSADTSNFRGLVAEALDKEEGYLRAAMLHVTKSHCVMVEDCHRVAGANVYYVHSEVLQGFDDYTFLAVFSGGSLGYLNIMAMMGMVYDCNEVRSRFATPVLYNLEGNPVPSCRGNVVAVVADTDDYSFTGHQKDKKDRGVVVVTGPTGETTEVTYSKAHNMDLPRNTRKLAELVAEKLALNPEHIKVMEDGTVPHTYHWKHEEFLDLAMDVPYDKRQKEVHVYSDSVKCLGVFTLYLKSTSRIDVSELLKAVEQLPQDVLSQLPDGELLVVVERNNEVDSICREDDVFSDFGYTLRIQPVPASHDGAPADIYAVTHYGSRAAIPRPFIYALPPTTTAPEALTIFRNLYFNPQPALTPHTYTRQAVPFRKRNPAYCRIDPLPWPATDDGSKWSLAKPGYNPKPLSDEPLAKQLDEYKGFRQLVINHDKKKSRNQGFVISS